MSTSITKAQSGQSGKRAATRRSAKRPSTGIVRLHINEVIGEKVFDEATGKKVLVQMDTIDTTGKKLPEHHVDVDNLLKLRARSSPLQWVEMVRKGVPVRSVGKFARNVGLRKDVIFSIIHLSRSTAHRLEQKNEVMDKLHSDAFVEAYAVIQKARKMLKSDDALRQWLSTPVLALRSQSPIEWLDTNLGRQIVSGLLDQIQSGAYA